MTSPLPRVQLLCQFGQPVRGLSPYGDSLLGALRAHEAIQMLPTDYQSAFPAFLHPAGGIAAIRGGQIHWANPLSWRRVARAPAEIIHIQHWIPALATYLWPLAAMARSAGKKVVVTVHNPRPHEHIAAATRVENNFLAGADRLIVHDERGAALLRARLRIPVERVAVIPHGIELRTVRRHGSAGDYSLLGLKAERRYFSLFGNLRGYKGVAGLLKAWREVLVAHPETDLVIAGRLWTGSQGLLSRVAATTLGTSGDAEEIRVLLTEPALSGRVLLRQGFQTDEQLDALIRVSDFAVFPYERFDSQSGAACRAAGMGCPVLVSDLGGLPELAIDADWIVPPRSHAGLVRALDSRLSMTESRGQLGRRQLDRVSGSSWAKVAASHAALYESLLSGGVRSKKH